MSTSLNPYTTPAFKVRPAIFPADKDATSSLFLAYEQFLLDTAGVTLDFQNFSHELSSLPGKYSHTQNGALYLAYISVPSLPTSSSLIGSPVAAETPIGCVGLRALSPTRSELKRLFLTPEARGLGVSKALMDVVILRARELGYAEIVLDTLTSMETARGLYEKYGFVEMEAYYQSHPDAVFYRLRL
ncbi:hypothetical protein SVAN01_07451 [Stagonosporopsis vannaccii]|nr:hypothetical protein SVAN01_07451 [Stagonosporopsis vannaccii]